MVQPRYKVNLYFVAFILPGSRPLRTVLPLSFRPGNPDLVHQLGRPDPAHSHHHAKGGLRAADPGQGTSRRPGLPAQDLSLRYRGQHVQALRHFRPGPLPSPGNPSRSRLPAGHLPHRRVCKLRADFHRSRRAAVLSAHPREDQLQRGFRPAGKHPAERVRKEVPSQRDLCGGLAACPAVTTS